MSTTAKLRAGVIGLGWAGQQHMQGYLDAANAELVAICGQEDDVAARLAGQFGVEQTYREVGDLLAVRGEISNYKPHAGSGHHYFTLKDATSCIDCVMFRDEATTLRFKPVVGMELIATGRVGVYSIKGKYQFYATSLAPVGQGALELARQGRVELAQDGPFNALRLRSVG